MADVTTLCPEQSEHPCPTNCERFCVCPVHGTRMTAHSAKQCQGNAGYRRAWKEGTGPGQLTPEQRAQLHPRRTKTVQRGGCGGAKADPAVKQHVARLARETRHPEIIDDADRYALFALRWAAGIDDEEEPFATRTPDDVDFIIDALCGSCKLYDSGAGTCGYRAKTRDCPYTRAKDHNVRVMAHMATASCPDHWW